MVGLEEIACRDDRPAQRMGGGGRVSRRGFRAVFAADRPAAIGSAVRL